MGFPVVMCGYESCTIKKAEHRRTDAFELWCWRRLLRVPWSARQLNQSILKEIDHEYSLEVLTLKLKLQYFGHMMRRTDSLEKTLMLGKIEGRGRRGWQRARWLDGIIDSMGVSLSKLQEMVRTGKPACCSPWGCKESDTTTWLNNNNKPQSSLLACWVSEASGRERGVWKDADILGVIYWPGKTGREKCGANDAQVVWFEEPGGTQGVKFRHLWDIRTHCSVAKLCLMLCNPMDCSTQGFPVLHYLPEFAQTHVHWVDDTIQPSHPLLSASPPALNVPQNQSLF